jgi:hypothetical protein
MDGILAGVEPFVEWALPTMIHTAIKKWWAKPALQIYVNPTESPSQNDVKIRSTINIKQIYKIWAICTK